MEGRGIRYLDVQVGSLLSFLCLVFETSMKASKGKVRAFAAVEPSRARGEGKEWREGMVVIWKCPVQEFGFISSLLPGIRDT